MNIDMTVYHKHKRVRSTKKAKELLGSLLPMNPKSMTDDEMLRAIAEAEGWTKIRLTTKGAGAPERGPSLYGYPPGRKYEAPLPNYLWCLNAIHRAEKVIDPNNRNDYIATLWKVCGFEPNSANFWTEYNYRGVYALTHATARQRAIAICRTLFPERFKI